MTGFDHISWTTIVLAAISAVFGSAGGIAVSARVIQFVLEKRINAKHAEKLTQLNNSHEEKVTELEQKSSENKWLREQIEDMKEQITQLEQRYETRFTAFEKRRDEDAVKRHAIANEANALKLDAIVRQKEMDQMTVRIRDLEKEEARLNQELSKLRNQMQA